MRKHRAFRFFISLSLLPFLNVLSACGGPGNETRLFTLNAPAAEAPPPPSTTHLGIALPRLAPGLEGEHILVRRGANTIDYYADAAWSSDLATLLNALTGQAFENRGLASVQTGTEGERGAYRLVSEWQDFQAEYQESTPTPTIHLRVKVMLLSPTRKMLATEIFEEHLAAPENTMNAVIATFDKALSRILREMADALSEKLPKVKTGHRRH